jgi:hypothetical protein
MADLDPLRELLDEVLRLQDSVATTGRRLDQEERRRRLAAAEVRPGQRGDSLLHETTTSFVKGPQQMTTLFLPVVSVQPTGNTLTIEACGKAAGAVATALRSAFRKITGGPLSQMHNHQLQAAGRILAASVGGDGTVTIRAQIEDRNAAIKTGHRIYPAISVIYSGAGEQCTIDEVALVDRDFSKISGAGGQVLAKIFSREDDKMAGEKLDLTPAELLSCLKMAGFHIAPLPQEPITLGAGSPQQRREAEGRAIELFKAALANPLDYFALRTGR